MNVDKLYTVAEVAALFNVDRETVRRWHRTNKIKTVQIGAGMIRVTESEIKRLMGE